MQVGSVTTPFGRRPMTLAMLAAQVATKDVRDDACVDKWKLYRALCEARGKLGITDRALTVLNALLSFYPKQELSQEQGLIVFPSNAQLSLRANGMPEATLRRHLAVLVSAGLLIRKDSANGKRYARRDGEGRLDEAFGFSLAPLVARAEEIEFKAAEVIAERLQLQRLREQLTICRRDVVKLIETALDEGAPGNWDAIHQDYRAVMASLPRNSGVQQVTETLGRMEELRSNIVIRLEKLANVRKTSGNAYQSERHIQNSKPDSISELEPSSRNELGAKPEEEPRREPEPLKPFPLGMVLRACPDISAYGPGGAISSWRDMMSAAVVVRSMLGVSPSAYQEACEVMGPENAATAMACILEKGGQINSAGGYLRDLTRKASRGEFSLGPMLMALLRTAGLEVRRVS
ncbi:Replication initiator RepC (plasmid) [Pseudorhizobium banfieldiae]|uniref:Replication initiator RepC n=1 Tax=Pseudorhizobium banfieldiae TaxID=1125847 RepID=L0NMS3_9HYPH|nr:plasmid replication protein RepC [Pseudorhizobium banfieldiae]CAD6628559.1 replication initiation protein RepC [arsenite-oxidising bacterium NT-25]CCF22370.1 Replication initiator RepC [Pseudorhizobium banfieldiae]